MPTIEDEAGTGLASRDLRVALVARHAMLRQGLARALEEDPLLRVVQEAESLGQAVGRVHMTQPDVALVDRSAFDPETERQIHAFRARRPGAEVVLLMPPGPDRSVVALRRAAAGTIPRTVEPWALGDALREALAGDGPLLPQGAASAPPAPAELTEREYEVLRALACGLTNRGIASELWLSEHTVKFHLSRIYRKLRLRSRTDAVRWLSENGVVPGEVGGA